MVHENLQAAALPLILVARIFSGSLILGASFSQAQEIMLDKKNAADIFSLNISCSDFIAR